MVRLPGEPVFVARKVDGDADTLGVVEDAGVQGELGGVSPGVGGVGIA